MNRRSFFFRAPAFLAAPAIVRVASLMPVSAPKLDLPSASLWQNGGSLTAVIIDVDGIPYRILVAA